MQNRAARSKNLAGNGHHASAREVGLAGARRLYPARDGVLPTEKLHPDSPSNIAANPSLKSSIQENLLDQISKIQIRSLFTFYADFQNRLAPVRSFSFLPFLDSIVKGHRVK